ncbi:MAG: MFS transporter [Chloroflexi bacterium]|nr:MFS transporter [Chloroflexota bacterium]
MASVNARRLQPEDVRFDAGGAVLLTLALVGLNIGLGGGGDLDTTRDFSGLQALPPYAIVMLVVAAASFVGFILVERRADTPLFDLRNFRDRNLSVASVVNLFVGFCLMVGLVSVPLFINAVFTQDLDEAALLSGLVLGALTIPMALAAVPGGLLTNRAGYRLPTALGLIVAAVGFALGLTWQADMSLWVMSGHMALAGIGLGLTVAPISTSMINAVAAPERGIASALVLVMRLVGMTIGTSAMTNYGLTRSNTLTERGVQPGMDFADLTQVAIDAASMVINEMLLIAAVVCVAALIPALFLHGKPEEENT